MPREDWSTGDPLYFSGGEAVKLFLCLLCHDVVRMTKEPRSCSCGHTQGRYVDDLNAELTEGAIPIGFNSQSLADAIKLQPDSGSGERFDAFVIPKDVPSIKRVPVELKLEAVLTAAEGAVMSKEVVIDERRETVLTQGLITDVKWECDGGDDDPVRDGEVFVGLIGELIFRPKEDYE